MNLILLERSEVRDDGSAVLASTRAAHLRKVLNVSAGSTVRIGVVDGPMGIGSVTAMDDDGVTLQCELDAQTPERPRVDVLLALPRPKVLRRLWAQLAALGVGQVILTNAEKVERDYFDSHVTDPEGYRPLLIEGLQQARDTRLPVVSIHKRFKVLVEDDLDALFPFGRRVVAHRARFPSPARSKAARTIACCSPSAPRAAGTRSNSICSRPTASPPPPWARAPSPRRLPVSRSSPSRTPPYDRASMSRRTSPEAL
jgi:RsmE family RNA methyltransferase